MTAAPLPRRLLDEFLGGALPAALVIGSGIAAQQLSEDVGLQPLANAAATAAGLVALILVFGAGLGHAPEPGRPARRRRLRRAPVARHPGLHPGPDRRLRGRRDPGQIRILYPEPTE